MKTKYSVILLLIIFLMMSSIERPDAGVSTAPSISGFDELEFEISHDAYTVSWNITDDNPKDYQITLDGAVFSEGQWEEPQDGNTAKTYQVSIDLLVDSNTYTLTLEVSDYDDLHASFTTIVNANNKATPDTILGPSLGEFSILILVSYKLLILINKRFQRSN